MAQETITVLSDDPRLGPTLEAEREAADAELGRRLRADEAGICNVCMMPAGTAWYAVRYEAGESPGIQNVRMHLCPPHAAVLMAARARPVVEVPR